MPYDVLPARLRDIIPSREGQETFRNVVNAQLAAGKSESVAMASAWAALQRAGYDKDEDGKWVKKVQPTPSQVHVPGAEWDYEDDDEDDDDLDDLDKAQTYQPPKAAQNAARRVLGWKEKYGDEVKGMTPVGWARARQLASGKPISLRTVARMSAFNRHRKNATVAPEYRTEPWKDAGYVAWLGWGNTTGVDWARRIMESVNKRTLNDDTFTTPEEASVRSIDLGLGGAVHVHQTADGMAVYMPGEDHEEYLEAMAERTGIVGDDEDNTEAAEESSEGLLDRIVSSMLRAAMDYDMNKCSAILKVDRERRIVWGWASVSTIKGELVTDLQGDRITPVEMERMADRFMRSARAAKAMHEGDDVGEVIHSFPLTKELAEAFGIQTDREGWITGTYIKSDEQWAKALRNEYRGLSIGGRAKRKPSDD